MNIQVKQTNHPKLAGREGFTVKKQTLEPQQVSVIARADGLGLRIDLGTTGSVILDITDINELDRLAAVVAKAIKNLEGN